MAQLSRPFQMALGAVLLLGLLGVIALHIHSSKPSEPAPTSASVPGAVAPKATKSAVPSSADPNATVRKGTVRKGTVRKADTRSRKPTAPIHKTTSHVHTTTVATHKTRTHKTVVVEHRTGSSSHKPTVRSSRNGVSPTNGASPTSKHAPEQAVVEHELAQGKTVMLVFWNPRTAVDREVQAQAGALANGSKGTVTLHSALANQVGLFGSITEVVHVYQTPTILIVNRHGVVSTLTGLTDVFALRQAVAEAQNVGH